MNHSSARRGPRSATEPLPAGERWNRIYAMLLPLGLLGAFLGFLAAEAVDFTVHRIDFAVHAVEVPATVVGVHHGSPAVEVAGDEGPAPVTVASGDHRPGSPPDITVHRHALDPTLLSVDHPLATFAWLPIAVLPLVPLSGVVLAAQRIRRYRARLRIASHERGGGRTGRALWGPVLVWAALAVAATGAACALAALPAGTPGPGTVWAGIGFALLVYGIVCAVEAWLLHAERAPAPDRPAEPGPPRGTRLLLGTLVAVPAAGMLTVLGLGAYTDHVHRLERHDTVAQTARIVDVAFRESARSGCRGTLTLAYEADGLPHVSRARTDCATAERHLHSAETGILRSVDDPSLVALPEDVR